MGPNGINGGVRGPAASATSTSGIEGGIGVWVIAPTTSPTAYAIPAGFAGMLCRVTAYGGDVQLLQGLDNTVAITKDAVTSGTTITAATGDIFVAGQSDRFEFNTLATYISVCGSTTCKLYIRVITQR